jgi:hypothetical protein
MGQRTRHLNFGFSQFRPVVAIAERNAVRLSASTYAVMRFDASADMAEAGAVAGKWWRVATGCHLGWEAGCGCQASQKLTSSGTIWS